MKTMIRKMFALLLVVAMLTSSLAVSAYAEGEAPDAAAAADQGGGMPGGGMGGGMPGGSSDPVDLTGMLSLSQYVFVRSQGEIDNGTVSATMYGIYGDAAEGENGTTGYDGRVSVYLDSDATQPAEGVTASISGGTLTISGVATEGNVAYYLTTEAGDYITGVYVVNSEAEDDATLTLADGTTVDLTSLAPNMGQGDYTAAVGENTLGGDADNSSIFIGGNRTAVSISDLTDTENFTGYEPAVTWFLQSGITNSGDTLTTFGSTMYNYEFAVALYREFQIVVDEVTAVEGFTDPTDFVGAMMSNDPFSDSVSATIQAGVWNGIFTEKSSTKSSGDTGYWLYENIDGVTTLGTGAVVTPLYAGVGVYNALQSLWSSLSETGETVAAQVEQAAATATAQATFTDAGTTESWAWAESFIGRAHAAGLFDGKEDGNFDAETELTRAEFAQVLYALAGKPAVEGETTNTFADLDPSQSWYNDAIEWAYRNGIVAGYSATEFGPEDSVTREQLAQMLMKYCKAAGITRTGTDSLTSFGDVADVSSWALGAVSWAVGNEMIAGSDGNLLPQDGSTRAMAATIISHLSDEKAYDYENSAKLEAVSSVLGVDLSGTEALTKAEAVQILYACRNLVASKTSPDESLAEKTGSATQDMSVFLTGYGQSPEIVDEYNSAYFGADSNLVSQNGVALFVKEGASATVVDSTVSTRVYAQEAADATTAEDENRAADGGEEVGHIYNATTRNANYRVGLGSALAIYGGHVTLTTTTGNLALNGFDGSGAGTAYSSYGGSLLVKNAVAYSAGQHLTNVLYNGSVHYVDSAAVSSGRVYSSDFWGGYQVFEDTIAVSTAENITDEPTTVIVKNTVYDAAVGGNGFASQYFENSILNVSTATFKNTTSLVTDAGALTVVNSVLNNSSTTLFASKNGENAILTLKDSTVNLGGNILATVANHDDVNAITLDTVTTDVEAYQHLYDADVAIRFYGDVTLNVTGALTVDVAEGSTLTVYSANLTAADITNTGAGTLKIVNGEQYGTVQVNIAAAETPDETPAENPGQAPAEKPETPAETPADEPEVTEIVPEASNVGQAAGIVIENGQEITDKEYTSGVNIAAALFSASDFEGTIETDSYYATGIALSGSDFTIRNSTITMGTSPEDNDSIEEGATPEIGAGAGVAVRDGSTVTIEDTTITTSGAWANMDYPRAGVVAGWQSTDDNDVVILRNTTITNDGNDENTSNVGYFPGMPGVPLNIMKNLTVSGQGRAFVVLGNTVSYLYNSDISGTGWAAICTDMATASGLYVYALGTIGKTTVGGYGIYSDGNCYDILYGSTLQGADFGAIISENGYLKMGASADADEETLANATEADIAAAADKQSTIAGGRNAIMTHATSAQTEEKRGSILLSDTVIYTSTDIIGTTEEQDYMQGFENYLQICDGAAILIKSSSENVVLKDCTVDSYTNTLVEAVVDSDNGGILAGATAPTNVITLDNVTTDNDSMDIVNYDFQRGMEVTVSNMTLNGKLDYITYAQYQEVNYLDGLNTIANTEDAGGLSLTIDESATWAPTAASNLTSLTVNGNLLGTVTVDGQVVEPEIGVTYTGNIVVTPAD